MYICLCNAITEEEVQELFDKGLTKKEIIKDLGLGSQCGLCLSNRLSIINCPEDSKSV